MDLRAKKQELLVQSELNRVQFLREWSTFKHGIRHIANPLRAAKVVASSTATAATLFTVARRFFLRHKTAPQHFWISNLIKGAKVGASVVALLRARKRRVG
jgi:hypothetical protein